jgi:restriction endonuclease S subunit
MQFDRLKTGSLQFNINKEQIQDIIVPDLSVAEQTKLLNEFSTKLADIKTARQNFAMMQADFSDSLGAKITSASGIKGQLKLRDFLGV